MTATERLRELLDERGVEHYDGVESTLWLKDEHGYRASADELPSGRMSVHIWCDTPEQAIAATLSDTDATAERHGDVSCNCSSSERTNGTCHMEEVDLDCDTASEYMLDRYCCFDAVYRCSCGHLFGHVARCRPNYCPNYGRKVTE